MQETVLAGWPFAAANRHTGSGKNWMQSQGQHWPIVMSCIVLYCTHRLTNVPSPGVAPLNTPGWLLSSSHTEYHL